MQNFISVFRMRYRRKKAPTLQSRLLCWHYLSFWVGQRIVAPSVTVQWTVTGAKKPRPFGRGCVLALPIFPGSRPPSIVGANELNFCVRDGNRWTLTAINTNSYGWGFPHLLYQCPVGLFAAQVKLGDPYRIRTDVNGVRGRCLNHLTNGPFWCTLRDSNPGPTD